MTKRELAGGLVAERFEGLRDLEGLESDWRALLAASGADPFCNGFAFVRAYAAAWLEAQGAGAPFGWVLRAEDGAPVAILPFRREEQRGRFALQRALLLVDGSFDGDYLDPLVAPGHERAAVEAAIDLLRRERGLQALVLTCVPAESRLLAAWRAVAAARRLPSRERPFPCAAAPVAPEYEAHLKTLPKRMRSKVRQARRRADEAGATARWCASEGELAEFLEALFDLHTRRWERAGEPGSFADHRRRQFYRELCPALLREGHLRLARLDLDGEPVSVQMGALIEGTYYQLQEGNHPDIEAFRPGVALRAWALEQMIADGLERYDFMGGESQHKRDWGAEPRDARTFACALPKLRGRLSYGLRAYLDRRALKAEAAAVKASAAAAKA